MIPPMYPPAPSCFFRYGPSLPYSGDLLPKSIKELRSALAQVADSWARAERASNHIDMDGGYALVRAEAKAIAANKERRWLVTLGVRTTSEQGVEVTVQNSDLSTAVASAVGFVRRQQPPLAADDALRIAAWREVLALCDQVMGLARSLAPHIPPKAPSPEKKTPRPSAKLRLPRPSRSTKAKGKKPRAAR